MSQIYLVLDADINFSQLSPPLYLPKFITKLVKDMKFLSFDFMRYNLLETTHCLWASVGVEGSESFEHFYSCWSLSAGSALSVRPFTYK